jgi:hypothetical protein
MNAEQIRKKERRKSKRLEQVWNKLTLLCTYALHTAPFPAYLYCIFVNGLEFSWWLRIPNRPHFYILNA